MTFGAAALLTATGLCAGVQNALAGGGSFLTIPALLFTGIDARAANITSTIALFPGQVATGLAVRRYVAGTPRLSFRWLFVISLIGGAAGALLLLATSSALFERLLPWLILFATALFALGSVRRPGGRAMVRPGRAGSIAAQAAVSVYGGYFGGGIGFLMLAALTLAGVALQGAQASKNVLAGVMNASAVLVFALSAKVDWGRAGVLAVAAVCGGQLGARLLRRTNDRVLRIAVVAIGAALTVAMFLRAYA